MPPMTFVTWKWQSPDPRRQFLPEHVNVLYAMLARHYQGSFRLVCITNDPQGLSAPIEVFPLPDTKADHVMSPQATPNKYFPSCYRRLWLFSKEAQQLGKQICQLDIDVIILRDITAMLHSRQADFVGWSDPIFGWDKIAGGLWMLTTGSHPQVWEQFDPAVSPGVAYAAGYRGSDQGWLSYMLYPPKERWTKEDGVIKLGWLPKTQDAPSPDIRMVFTPGHQPPWSAAVQHRYPWIKAHWRL